MDIPSALKRSKVPAHLRPGLVSYIVNHRPPSGFLLAVLSNNLTDALHYGDDESRACLHEIVTFLVWDAPAMCWGSKDRVTAWLSTAQIAEEAEA